MNDADSLVSNTFSFLFELVMFFSEKYLTVIYLVIIRNDYAVFFTWEWFCTHH